MNEDEMPKHFLTILNSKSFVLGAVVACLPSLYASNAYAVGPRACGAFMEQYSIQPYRNWGSMPPRMQQIWDASDCNHKICRYMQAKYNVVPHLSWGSLPRYLQRVWDTPAVDCNNQV
jgi:hypothetical protein